MAGPPRGTPSSCCAAGGGPQNLGARGGGPGVALGGLSCATWRGRPDSRRFQASLGDAQRPKNSVRPKGARRFPPAPARRRRAWIPTIIARAKGAPTAASAVGWAPYTLRSAHGTDRVYRHARHKQKRELPPYCHVVRYKRVFCVAQPPPYDYLGSKLTARSRPNFFRVPRYIFGLLKVLSAY
jgi:hypothetical protein